MENIEKFDQIAALYDTPERIKISKAIAEKIRTTITDGQAKHVIDYGSGTGLIGLQLLDDVGSMLFIDTSSRMIEKVKQKIDLLHIHNAEANCCDFKKEYPAGLHADYVILVQTLKKQKLKQEPRFVKQLLPNGLIFEM